MNFTGTTGKTLTGNNGADTITDSGTGGSNILSDGGANTGGAHLVHTGTGSGDTYIVSNTNDTVTENHASGSLIQSSVDYSLAGTGATSLTLTANGPSNAALTATGSGGATAVKLTDAVGGNVLDASGDSGADTLVGGNDTMIGGGGADHFQFSADTAFNGIATITGFVHLTDKLDIHDIISGGANPGAGGLGVSYRFDETGGNTTHFMVDYDGAGVNYSFIEVATITGVIGLTGADVL